jgi:hypothetical protein
VKLSRKSQLMSKGRLHYQGARLKSKFDARGVRNNSKRSTYVLIGNDFDAQDMTIARLKNLLEHVFGYPRVQTSDVKSSLVWFGSSAA